MALDVGQVLNNRYRIDALIGQGGFGAVYRSWDTVRNRACALKENLDTSEAAVEQFEEEAVILASLKHPSLPRVTDHFILPGQGQYLVMDFVEGQSLAAMVQDHGGHLAEAEALTWVGQVCDALIYLHSQIRPIIHRDIKPQNIIVTPDGRAMLVDFGISKVYDPAMSTKTGSHAITQGFSPPEQYGMGRTDARSDVYALGATLYYLLTGQVPPDAIDRLAESTPLVPPRRLNAAVSPATQAAVLKAMDPHTTQRFQTAEQMRQALGVGVGATVAPGKTTVAPTMRVTEAAPGRRLPGASDLQGSLEPVRQALAGGRPARWLAVALVAVVAIGALALAKHFADLGRGGAGTPTPSQVSLAGLSTGSPSPLTPEGASGTPPTGALALANGTAAAATAAAQGGTTGGAGTPSLPPGVNGTALFSPGLALTAEAVAEARQAGAEGNPPVPEVETAAAASGAGGPTPEATAQGGEPSGGQGASQAGALGAGTPGGQAVDTATVGAAVLPGATDTAEPPTDTPFPATDTAAPPTDTPLPPTAVPTDTSLPATDTPLPPADTPIPPTDTAVPPPAVPTAVMPASFSQTQGAPGVLFYDTFASNQNGWDTGRGQGQHTSWDDEFQNGTYVETVQALTDGGGVYGAVPGVTAQDFQLSLDATFLQASQDAGIDIYFRCQDNTDNNCYWAGFRSSGAFSFGRWQNGQFSALQDWTPGTAILTGAGQTNTLAVVASGSTFALYANGQRLLVLSDATFSSGSIQLGVSLARQGDQARVAFRNLFVTQPAGGTTGAGGTLGRLLVMERFDDNSLGWALGPLTDQVGYGDFEINGGKLTATLAAYQNGVIAHRPVPNVDVADFVASVNVTFASASSGAGAVIAFRCQDSTINNCYTAAFLPNGYFAVDQSSGGQETALQNWTYNSALHTGLGAAR